MNIVTTEDALTGVVEYFMDADFLCFDVETTPAFDSHSETRGDPWRNTVVWISVASSTHSWVIPMGHLNGEYIESKYPLKDSGKIREAKGLPLRPSDYSTLAANAVKVFTPAPAQLSRSQVFKALKPLLCDPSILKVGHNLSFDLGSVAKYIGGIPVGPYADTMIAAFLVDSSKGYGFGLKDVSKQYADIDMVKGVGAKIELHSFTDVAKYADLDATATAKVWTVLRERLAQDSLLKVFALEMDVLKVVTNMRLTGALVDTDSLTALRDRLDSDIESAKGRIFRTAGETFSVNSSAAKQRLLFTPKSEGGRGLKPIFLTPGGKEKKRTRQVLTNADYSVSAEALQPFRSSDALVDAMLDYSDLNKLMTTYVVPYMGGTTTRITNGKTQLIPKVALMDKGRLHTDFNQIGAATGRLSSRNPNLQNVPNASTEYGKLIRNLFIAPEGHRLVVADYSQIEPRIIASLSKDPVMLATYRDGGDIYTTIGEVMGVDRKAGKVLVLSIAYGVGPDKIASQIGCTKDAAENLLLEFSAKFKNIPRCKALTVKKARKEAPVPFVLTITGRRRYLPDLSSAVGWQVAKAERQAFNTLIQGSAADIMKIAMVRAARLTDASTDLILTVHDELVTVTPEAIAEETADAIRVAMEDIHCLSVPLLADITIVDRWGDAK